MKKQKDTASLGAEIGPGPSTTSVATQFQIRSKITWQLETRDQEVNQGVSETQEDETYTLKELLVRFTQGLPLNQGNGFYADGDGEPDIDGIDLEDFNRMDPTEQMEILEAVSSKKRVAQETAKAAEAAKMKAEREAKKARIAARKLKREQELSEVLKRHQKS